MQKKWPAVQLVIVFISKQIQLNANIHIYSGLHKYPNTSRGETNRFGQQ